MTGLSEVKLTLKLAQHVAQNRDKWRGIAVAENQSSFGPIFILIKSLKGMEQPSQTTPPLQHPDNF